MSQADYENEMRDWDEYDTEPDFQRDTGNIMPKSMHNERGITEEVDGTSIDSLDSVCPACGSDLELTVCEEMLDKWDCPECPFVVVQPRDLPFAVLNNREDA